MSGQMSLFDFIEDPDREKKEKAKAWSAGRQLAEGYREGVNKKCRTCAHMKRSVWGLMEYHGFACFGFGISKSQDIEKMACEYYTPATDGEAWRTSENAAKAWMEEEGEERGT